ncbi:MAG: hypothetical protein U5R30_01065 [Deltaproteobacteria bacterium]|nr:hypothetical protein [Deltaproteobacteria bacterium]
MELVVYPLSRSIQAVEPEYGFHFEKKTMNWLPDRPLLSLPDSA